MCRLRIFFKSKWWLTKNDEVTRLIVDTHDAEAFAPVRSFTVGELRDWLLSDEATPERLAALPPASRRRWPQP